MPGIMKQRSSNEWVLLFIVLLFCAAGLWIIYGIWSSAVNGEEPEDELMTVNISPENVYQVDLYWNYDSFSINRKEDPTSVDRAAELLNGEYTAVGVWISGLATGSADRVDFYDKAGNLLTGHRIYTDEDRGLSIGSTNSNRVRYNKYRKMGGEDDSSLLELVSLFKVNLEWYR